MADLASTDFLIIGAGVVGLSLSIELKKHFSDSSITIIEKEPEIGLHASGRNSGVLHAGFYYTANSLKAQLCREGNKALTEYCLERKLNINQCGKLVVATNETELETLDVLFQRGLQNKVELELISEQQMTEIEPKAFTVDKALYSPTTASVDPLQVIRSMYEDAIALGIQIQFDSAFISCDKNTVKTVKGKFNAAYVINTAGLYADKIAKCFGFSQKHAILPFKGLYLYAEEGAYSLNTNIYPVPDLENPFLGVHFTVTASGLCKIGPTAIPAFWRENYEGLDGFDVSELVQILRLDTSLFYRNEFGFRKLAFEEMQKYSRKKLIKLASRLVREIDEEAFSIRGKAGIRAQLVNVENNTLEMDFKFEGDDKSFHVLNAVSPAFTCSIPFSQLLVEEIRQRL